MNSSESLSYEYALPTGRIGILVKADDKLPTGVHVSILPGLTDSVTCIATCSLGSNKEQHIGDADQLARIIDHELSQYMPSPAPTNQRLAFISQLKRWIDLQGQSAFPAG